MDLGTNLRCIDLRSSFFTGSALTDVRKTGLRSHFRPHVRPIPSSISAQFIAGSNSIKIITLFNSTTRSSRVSPELSAVAMDSSVAETMTSEDIESLFSKDSADETYLKRGNKQSNSGASSISSGVRLENVSKVYKGVTVLKNVSWEVKKGEKVGLVGVNGAGKTTQLRIITGLEEPDSGNVIKAKPNMKIAFLSQEFEVSLSRTVREEFMSAFKEEMEIAAKLEKLQKAIESSVDDLDLMGRLLDEYDSLQRRAQAVDLDEVDVKISKLMPELGFAPEDSDRLVASFSSGWQMRMSLGKILLQVYLCIHL